jgi:hypothetical protein
LNPDSYIFDTRTETLLKLADTDRTSVTVSNAEHELIALRKLFTVEDSLPNMSLPFSRPSLNQMLSKSILGTILVLLGGVVLLAGSLYAMALGLTELLSPPPAGPTPAGNSSIFSPIGAVILIGLAIVVLGGQLIGYSG